MLSGAHPLEFRKRGLLRKIHSLEFRDSRHSRERQTLENKGVSDHFLEILENLEIFEILKTPFVMTLFPVPIPLELSFCLHRGAKIRISQGAEKRAGLTN